tara:strand:- start:666 stop:1376 length:711 start_codon:yes stop_codon:yes gene_type:complete
MLIILVIFYSYNKKSIGTVNHIPVVVNLIEDKQKKFVDKSTLNNKYLKTTKKIINKESKLKVVKDTVFNKKQVFKKVKQDDLLNFESHDFYFDGTEKNQKKIKIRTLKENKNIFNFSEINNSYISTVSIPKKIRLISIDSHHLNYKVKKFNEIQITPEYPRFARLRGIEGKVILSLSIDSSMKIIKVSLDTSSGYKILDLAALKAARKIKNKKFQASGILLPTKIKVPITFQLKSG